jgi:hypothetical protein
LPASSDTARGSVSASVGVTRAGAASRAGAPEAARTMLGSTTRSVGPPVMIRCSTLSRRISQSCRRASIDVVSITARRGWRPRGVIERPSALPPKRLNAKAQAQISTSTTRNARTNLPPHHQSKPCKACIGRLRLSCPARPFHPAREIRFPRYG